MIPERRFVCVPARRRKGKPSGNFHCNTRWNGGKVEQRSRNLKILRDSCIHLLAFWGKTLYHRDKSVYFEKAPSGAKQASSRRCMWCWCPSSGWHWAAAAAPSCGSAWPLRCAGCICCACRTALAAWNAATWCCCCVLCCSVSRSWR